MISFYTISRVRTLFLQCVSLTYAVALYSLYTQIPGLYGDDGILPAVGQIDQPETKANILGTLWRNPSLFYFASNIGLSIVQMMELICLFGTGLGLLVTCLPDLNMKFTLFILWSFYISIYKVGQTFMWFQWDILLLETGFLAIILAPWSPGYTRIPLVQDHISLFLVRWLLFRMMFASGVVKLTSGCDTWWGLTAMPTHYFSQCIPTPLAWFAFQLPTWIHKLSVASTFVIEIPLTFLFFSPSASMRKFTFLNQIFLMIVIMLTGNYNFFNFLYIALCLSLADDSWIQTKQFSPKQHALLRCFCCLCHVLFYSGLGIIISKLFGIQLNPDFTVDSQIEFTRQSFDLFLSYSVPAGVLLGAVGLFYSVLISLYNSLKSDKVLFNLISVIAYAGIGIFMFGTSLPSFTGPLNRTTYDHLPKIVKSWDKATNQFELTGSYGLFRRMTGVGGRPEIVIEGANSLHGPWLEYSFLYKPGNTSVPPKFCLPHQPRLDWQMWFAALGSYEHNPWFLSLILRLLEGRNEVLNLLDPQSSFAKTPPKFIRAQLYKYTFTELNSGSEDWWIRHHDREYLPPVSLETGLEKILSQQGIIGAKSVTGSGWIADTLSSFRTLSTQSIPHIQIWSFSWLAIPLIKPFIFV